MILVNGENKGYISASDRGFQYGDGVFETIEVINAKPVFLKQHLDRLFIGCRTLRIPPPDLTTLKQEVQQVCLNIKLGVLKIIITRGIGGRGYCPPVNPDATRVLSLHPFPDYVERYANQGINARFCKSRLGVNPVLAGIKHLNRLEQIMARAEWDDPEIQEGIVLNINEHVIEGTMSNLFYIKNRMLHTACLDTAGVSGVVRGVIKMIASQQNLNLIEHDYGQQSLLDADELFMCNSIIGIWPVINLAGIDCPIGPITRQLQSWLKEFKAKDCVDE
jgi:4-amino-4-deoxychorismate lyase